LWNGREECFLRTGWFKWLKGEMVSEEKRQEEERFSGEGMESFGAAVISV